MAQNKPLVSVIIPVYNGERYLAEAIESVLVQTYRPIEVIVVDDGSTDRSADVAKRFSHTVRHCFQHHSGIGAARNQGIGLAQGSFFAFLDADDLWVKDKLTRQMAIFDADSELDIAFGHVKQFFSLELNESVTKKIRCPDELMPGYLPSVMLVRRDAFIRVGPFETNRKLGEFISWYLRATELGLRIMMLPDLVVWRRLHEANQGVRQRQAVTDYVQILKASLDRRRAASQEKGDV